jgi:hypothetical protein
MKKLGTYFFLLFSVFCLAHKGDSTKLSNAAKLFQLKSIASDAFYSRKEADRMAANKEFIKAIEAIATHSEALDFPFDSIKDISTLTPKDKKFKLITWNVHKDDQTHLFFGFLMVNNSKRVRKGFMKHETITNYEYFKLIDNSGSIKNPETHIGTTDKWFGMIYYSMIECDGYYTLLGFDPNDKLISRKFIDALYFKPDGTPVFGKDIFKFPRKNPKRLMFEYSADVTMSLKYNEKTGNIVYSHLGPREEGEVLQGLPQYYGPDGSFDALYLKKGKWNLFEDADVRSGKNKKDKDYNDPTKVNSTDKTKLVPKQK